MGWNHQLDNYKQHKFLSRIGIQNPRTSRKSTGHHRLRITGVGAGNDAAAAENEVRGLRFVFSDVGKFPMLKGTILLWFSVETFCFFWHEESMFKKGSYPGGWLWCPKLGHCETGEGLRQNATSLRKFWERWNMSNIAQWEHQKIVISCMKKRDPALSLTSLTWNLHHSHILR